MTTAYPPIHHHSTTRISPSAALSLLSTYLEATETDPSLHPNAILTENGPFTPASGTSIGLILHNLKRVEAGLKGEHLDADLTFEDGGEGLPDSTVGENAVAGSNDALTGGQGKRNGQMQGQSWEGEWQDKEEFEREQDIMNGEIGRRDNAIDGDYEGMGNHIPKVKTTISSGDKEARKKAKKDKRKQNRTDTLAKKMREKDEEG